MIYKSCEAVYLISRAVKTIDSCETDEQLKTATAFIELLCKRYAKIGVGGDMFDGMNQYWKSQELNKELLDLIRLKSQEV